MWWYRHPSLAVTAGGSWFSRFRIIHASSSIEITDRGSRDPPSLPKYAGVPRKVPAENRSGPSFAEDVAVAPRDERGHVGHDPGQAQPARVGEVVRLPHR